MGAKGMAYRQAIIDRLDKQTEKGIKKYGGTIDKSGHLETASESLEYLAEELTDGLVYIEHTKNLVYQTEQELAITKNRLSTTVNALRAIAFHGYPGEETAQKALAELEQ